MFEKLEMAPPDPILGIAEAFAKDPRTEKINLSVGVYKDANGRTPVLRTVKTAEERILAGETTKSYKPIDGDPVYNRLVQTLLFGDEHEVIRSRRAVTADTPGGTGGLRVAADYVHTVAPDATVWVSDPTWANHPNIFRSAGLRVATYPYFDPTRNTLDFKAFQAAIEKIPAGDVLLLHACCHNPTGVDPSPAEWQTIAEIVAARRILPLVDFAYQGFGDGLSEDAAGLRALLLPGVEALVSSSFSKNFGLYNERVGALTLVAGDAAAAAVALSHIKIVIRTNYSNPPAHGAAIVATILSDPELHREWEAELASMRDRINGMRARFVDTLREKGVERDFSFIREQRGMFSFSGLDRDQVARLRDEHAIYIVGSGRINVAGMTAENLPRLCDAIARVL